MIRLFTVTGFACLFAVMLSCTAIPAQHLDPRLFGSWGLSGYGTIISYTFRANGTYQQSILSTSGVIRGLSSSDGHYTVDGSLLTMHEAHQSWRPDGSGQTPAFSNKPTNFT